MTRQQLAAFINKGLATKGVVEKSSTYIALRPENGPIEANIVGLALIGMIGIEGTLAYANKAKSELGPGKLGQTILEIGGLFDFKEDQRLKAAPPMDIWEVMKLGEKRPAAKIAEQFAIPSFVLKYVLPTGELVGYHIDSIGQTDLSKGYAKIYQSVTEEEQIAICKRGLLARWNSNYNSNDQNNPLYYRDFPKWKGYGVDEIQIVAEPFEILKTILIVEDSNAWIRTYVKNLPAANILTAQNLADGEKLFLATPNIDLIIMDGCVDDEDVLDSLPLIYMMRRTYQGDMVAASGSLGYRQDMMRAGCNMQVSKDYVNKIILKKLND